MTDDELLKRYAISLKKCRSLYDKVQEEGNEEILNHYFIAFINIYLYLFEQGRLAKKQVESL